MKTTDADGKSDRRGRDSRLAADADADVDGDGYPATVPSQHAAVPSALDLVPSRKRDQTRVFAPHRVLRLQAWPEMRYLAPAHVARHARICALLAVRPSVAYLVHRRLGLPRDGVMTALRELHERGFLEVVGDGFDQDAWRASEYAEDDSAILDTRFLTDAAPAPAGRAPSRWDRLARRMRG